MPSWHQQKSGTPYLAHPTKWRCYNPQGHLSVMTFDSERHCLEYCGKTGDVPIPPTNTAPKKDTP